MKSTKILLSSLFILLILLTSSKINAQNTAITDSDSYTPHSSAMLDVYSLSKGLLVPRLTSAQRTAISTPAEGLLVYDTDLYTYYYFANSRWNPIDAPSLWSENNDTIFITGDGKRYGVGTASPLARLTVQGDATIGPDEPLFEVKNSAGDVIFAVYENEVKVNFKESAKGVKGGFAVGGLSGTKADPIEYMRITPDSVRIYIDDTGTKGVKGGFAVGGLSGTKGGNQYFKLDEESASIYLKQPAKGVKGGFAVGGLSGTKGSEDFLTIGRDSARIYINDAAKGVKGGFAVGGLSGTKGPGDKYLTIERDSARIYIDESAKGVKGGFAVGGLSGTKASSSFLNMTPENYFIGQDAGANTQPNDAPEQGKYNQFFGYQAGLNNEVGLNNIYIGYQSGFTGQGGNFNTFMGYQAGYTNTGSDNTFIGYLAGNSHQSKGGNVYIGSRAGENATLGEQNVYIGESAGSSTTYGKKNVFIGFQAGYYNTGTSTLPDNGGLNVFLGNQAGWSNTTGKQNVFVGNSAGLDNTTGYNNVFIGNLAGSSNTNYLANVMIGESAGASANVAQAVFVGQEAGTNVTTGFNNTFIGAYTGRVVTTGGYNSFIGNQAGYYNITGRWNTALGYFAGPGNGYTHLDNATALGRGATNTADNQVRIGNTSVSSIGGQVGWSTLSDKRFKKRNKGEIHGLDFILKLEPVSYHYDISAMNQYLKTPESTYDDAEVTHFESKTFVGFFAQDVEKVANEIGFEFSGIDKPKNDKDYYSLRYAEFTIPLVKAVQELNEKNVNQQSQIELLKKDNNELKKRIERLEKLISE